MAIAKAKWFDDQTYMTNKLAQMQTIDPTYSLADLEAAFERTGFTGEEGLYNHFVKYGNAENVSPTDYFDVEYYFQSKAAQFFSVDFDNVTSDQIALMKASFKKVGLSAWDHYLKYGMKEGIDPSAKFDTSEYMNAKLAQMQTSDPDYTIDQLYEAFQNAKLNPVEHYFGYGLNEGLAPTYVSSANSVPTQQLTVDVDDLQGTTFVDFNNISVDSITQNDDYFNAELGTLNSADKIDGLGGNDILYARVEADEGTAYGSIEPTVKNVETVLFRSQIGDGYNLADHTSAPVSAVVDADRILLDNTSDNLTLGSDNSRAHLAIEDVRHNSNVTTIRFADADPTIDFRVFFDPQHLKSDATTQSGTLNVELMDVFNADPDDGTGQPLLTNPYNQFNFYYTPNGGSATLISLVFPNDTAEDVALYTGETANYDSLVQAFNNALTALYPELVGTLEITKGPEFLTRAYSNTDGVLYEATGNYVQISANDGSVDCPSGTEAGWYTDGVIPPNSNYDTRVTSQVVEDCPLIKVNVEVTNVGRVQWDDASPHCLPDDILKGSEAGDLEIGSMSMRSGVERMDVVVDEGSWLKGLYSTNNTLRMVTVRADDINEADTNKGDGHVGNVSSLANGSEVGQLYIGSWKGKLDLNANDPDNLTWTDRAQLLTAAEDVDTGAWSGLKDVAVFDASNDFGVNSEDYAGDINIAAAITYESYDKYFKFVDGEKYINSNNAPTTKYNGHFTYLTGSGDDTVNMDVNGDIASDVDFNLDIITGDGADLVAFSYESLKAGSQEYNQKYLENVTVQTGAGDDTVWFYGAEVYDAGNLDIQNLGGSLVINTSTGNDVVYANQIDFFTGGINYDANTNDPTNPNSTNLLDADHYNAVWLFNNGDGTASGDATANQIHVAGYDGATLNNNAETGLSSFGLVATAATLGSNALYATVDFKGLTAEAKVADYRVTPTTVNGVTTYNAGSVSAEELNHGIINAIENSVLSDLLVAKDGAGHTLMVESLINGTMDVADLTVNFELRDNSGVVIRGDDVFTTGTTASGWYGSEFATDGANPYDGSYDVADTPTSQVIVNTDSGDDLIVLGPQGLKDIVQLTNSFGDDIIVGFESGVDKLVVGNTLGYGYTLNGTATQLVHNNFAVITTSAGDDGVFSSSEISALMATQIDFASRLGSDAGQRAVVFVNDSSGNSDGQNYTALLVTNNGTSDPTAEVLGTLTFEEATFADVVNDFSASLVGTDGMLVDQYPSA